MEFVSNVEDMLGVVGKVRSATVGRGIYMALPEQTGTSDGGLIIHRIVYGLTESGKRYIETISSENGFPTYGEASIPEILVFARKAAIDMPESEYTRELCAFAQKIEAALKEFK
jgi:hypothetical protein